MTRRCVPDTSVLLKWVLDSADEEERDLALALRGDWLAERIEIRVPALWAFEVGNVLVRREPALAPALLGAMLDLQLDEVPTRDLAPRALELAARFRSTFYDASYHAAAIACEGTLVTCDRQYARRAAAAGHLLLLRDYRPA